MAIRIAVARSALAVVSLSAGVDGGRPPDRPATSAMMLVSDRYPKVLHRTHGS
ncbi:hypothetical protein I546_3471 [Mycobacterium kansasii 732]|nr:hypothetical protein I546_3471 [Mycobacterium kansasii 732]